MILPDVNVLVCAYRREAADHERYATWLRFTALAAEDRAVRGNLVPDAFLASVALVHGGRVATADRGFARFPGLQWFDPLAAA